MLNLIVFFVSQSLLVGEVFGLIVVECHLRAVLCPLVRALLLHPIAIRVFDQHIRVDCNVYALDTSDVRPTFHAEVAAVAPILSPCILDDPLVDTILSAPPSTDHGVVDLLPLWFAHPLFEPICCI